MSRLYGIQQGQGFGAGREDGTEADSPAAGRPYIWACRAVSIPACLPKVFIDIRVELMRAGRIIVGGQFRTFAVSEKYES